MLLWLFIKKILNNGRGLNVNNIDKENDFSSDNKSFKTLFELSKEYDRNINLNPDSNENTEELDEYSYDDYSVSYIMENFVNKFNK